MSETPKTRKEKIVRATAVAVGGALALGGATVGVLKVNSQANQRPATKSALEQATEIMDNGASRSEGGRPVTTEGSTSNGEANTQKAYERTAKVVTQYAESVLDTNGKFKDAPRFSSTDEDGKTSTRVIVPVGLTPGTAGDHGEYAILLTGYSGSDGLQASEVTELQVNAVRSSSSSLNARGRENTDTTGGTAFVKTEGGWDLATWGENAELSGVQNFVIEPENGVQNSGDPLSAEGFLAQNASRTDQLLRAATMGAPIGEEFRFS